MSRRYYFSDKLAARRSRNRNFKLCVVLVLIIAVSAGSAWSQEPASSSGVFASATPASLSPPLSMTDKCLPLLKSIRHIAPDTVTDKTQRPAGNKAAVLGLALGIRYALGPIETPKRAPRSTKTSTLVDFRQSQGDIDGRNALTTVAYRDCRKREALAVLEPGT
jgi:hypothetical protein